MPVFRDATVDDLPAIAQIFDHHVRVSTATFETRELGVDPWTVKHQNITRAGRPFLVVVEDDKVLGFTYADTWRDRPAYRGTVEESIYFDPTATGRGLGTDLLGEMLQRLPAAGVHTVLAIISDHGADASLALHRRAGFQQVGHLREIGEKFGRSLGTYLFQLSLGR